MTSNGVQTVILLELPYTVYSAYIYCIYTVRLAWDHVTCEGPFVACDLATFLISRK